MNFTKIYFPSISTTIFEADPFDRYGQSVFTSELLKEKGGGETSAIKNCSTRTDLLLKKKQIARIKKSNTGVQRKRGDDFVVIKGAPNGKKVLKKV